MHLNGKCKLPRAFLETVILPPLRNIAFLQAACFSKLQTDPERFFRNYTTTKVQGVEALIPVLFFLIGKSNCIKKIKSIHNVYKATNKQKGANTQKLVYNTEATEQNN